MPIFGDDDSMETQSVAGSNYGFSAKRIGDLGATEYTLVGLAADVSTSVTDFAGAIESCVKEVVDSCRKSPRADNLMLRFTTFSTHLEEQHGFRQLSDCDPDKYTGCIQPRGMTALYDAAHNMVVSMGGYGKDLADQDYEVNGIMFVLTDGMNNSSTETASSVAEAVAKIRRDEALESMLTILIGVNITDPQISQYLKTFETEGKFDQYVELEKADASTLAKLAAFVSKSISSQSQSLGSGGASTVLSF